MKVKAKKKTCFLTMKINTKMKTETKANMKVKTKVTPQ